MKLVNPTVLFCVLDKIVCILIIIWVVDSD